jgi:hypothetical protein
MEKVGGCRRAKRPTLSRGVNGVFDSPVVSLLCRRMHPSPAGTRTCSVRAYVVHEPGAPLFRLSFPALCPRPIRSWSASWPAEPILSTQDSRLARAVQDDTSGKNSAVLLAQLDPYRRSHSTSLRAGSSTALPAMRPQEASLRMRS